MFSHRCKQLGTTRQLGMIYMAIELIPAEVRWASKKHQFKHSTVVAEAEMRLMLLTLIVIAVVAFNVDACNLPPCELNEWSSWSNNDSTTCGFHYWLPHGSISCSWSNGRTVYCGTTGQCTKHSDRDGVHMTSPLRGGEGVGQFLTKGKEVVWIS